MPIITPAARKISWSELRQGIKEVIMAAAPTARVHNRWGLKYNLESTIARLKSENDSDLIHAWMIKIGRVSPQHVKVGGGEITYPLVIDIWGFRQFEFGTDADNTQTEFEDEVDDVITYLDANRLNAFGLDPEQRKYLRDFSVEQDWELDIASFGEAYDVHVAKGVIIGKVVRIP